MYINHNHDFLIVVQDPNGSRELRAYSRRVKLSQCGHWMMGRTKLCGREVVLSGAYGSDGLPDDIRQYFVDNNPVDFTAEEKKAVWATLLPLPKDLLEEFWAGGGHNTSGKEAPAMRKWANENRKALRKAARPCVIAPR